MNIGIKKQFSKNMDNISNNWNFNIKSEYIIMFQEKNNKNSNNSNSNNNKCIKKEKIETNNGDSNTCEKLEWSEKNSNARKKQY